MTELRFPACSLTVLQPVLAYKREIYFSPSTATISIPSTISAPTFYDTSGVRDWQSDIDTADSPTTITSYSPLTMGLSAS